MVAKPLPARDPNSKSKATGQTKKEEKARQAQKFEKKRKTDLDDDTPRAFRRLMQVQAKHQQQQQQQQKPQPQPQSDGKKRKRGGTESSTQDGSKQKKKPGKAPATNATTTNETSKPDSKFVPHILPGEKLSDFAARVDREMPLSEMKRSNKASPADLPKIREQRLTKHDKRLRRLQSQWREDEEKIQEREAIEREDREAEMEDQLELWKQWEKEAGKSKAKKGPAPQKKKKKNKGEENGDGVSDDDDYDPADPWAKLNKPERVNKAANPQDVVQAPPQLTKPREIFKVRGGAKVNVDNVPTAMGSLRRREELADERKNIVEEYRRLMAEKRQ